MLDHDIFLCDVESLKELNNFTRFGIPREPTDLRTSMYVLFIDEAAKLHCFHLFSIIVKVVRLAQKIITYGAATASGSPKDL